MADSVWAVVEKINPHVPNSHNERIVVVYDSQEEAANFYLLHPQYHYKMGESEPRVILELKEMPLNQVAHWWDPSFP